MTRAKALEPVTATDSIVRPSASMFFSCSLIAAWQPPAPRRRATSVGGEIVFAQLLLIVGARIGLKVGHRLRDLLTFAAEAFRRSGFPAGGEASNQGKRGQSA